ncbi:MAG: hypothetical protein ACOC1O_01355 [bacterium]
MLKNIVNKAINFLIKKSNFTDPMHKNFIGHVEVIAERNGEIVHYDEGYNTVTVWGKHLTMHLLSGESWSSHGTVGTDPEVDKIFSSRSIDPLDHDTETPGSETNADGTLISGEQYFSNNDPYYNVANSEHLMRTKATTNLTNNPDIGVDSTDGFIYSKFPTKILLGTGIEFQNWAEIDSAGLTGGGSGKYDEGNLWSEELFDTYLVDGYDPGTGSIPQLFENYYSNTFNPVFSETPITDATRRIVRARTVNDLFTGEITTAPSEWSYGISGAIKDATIKNFGELATKTTDDGNGNFFADGSYRGIGHPSFIYPKRELRYYQNGAEVALDNGLVSETENLETRLTYTVILPDQPNGEFYPYNGYTLKEAGLFADARFNIDNAPSNSADIYEAHYQNMPTGILWAKRNIAPVYKSHDTKITLKWTIYLP